MPWLDPLTTATRPARLRGADDLAAIVLVLRYKESILVSANGEEELDIRWHQRKRELSFPFRFEVRHPCGNHPLAVFYTGYLLEVEVEGGGDCKPDLRK